METAKSAIRHPVFFNRYVEQVGPGDICNLLAESIQQLEHDLKIIGQTDCSFAYAPEKWSISTLVRHCIDTEMIFAFRALSIARKDPNPIRSFAENQYALEAEKEYGFHLLSQEFLHIRRATALLFQGFDKEWMTRTGQMENGDLISVRSLGYIVVGHWLHHRKILATRYGIKF